MTKATTKDSKPTSTTADSRGSRAMGKAPPNAMPQIAPPVQLLALQRKMQEGSQTPVQRKEAPEQTNPAGLPNALKAGVEHLSGMSMDDVRVHYNSSKPAQMKAAAYTQGSDIYVGPGQNQHIAHEAWHAAQQKQGRVQATMQMKNAPVNADPALETEADVMGAKAQEWGSREPNPANVRPLKQALSKGGNDAPIQGAFNAKYFASDSDSTMKEVWNDYQAETVEFEKLKKEKKKAVDPQIPWAEINDLYVALIPTGPGSWEPIVDKRYNKGDKKFTVFTGAHGNVGGQFLDDEGNYIEGTAIGGGKFKDGYRDDTHTAEDNEKIEELKKRSRSIIDKQPKYPGLDIKALSIFTDTYDNKKLNNSGNLQAAVKAEISNGRVVILAWCFSLEGFTTRVGILPEKGKESDDEKEFIRNRNDVELKDIIAEQYGDLDNYKYKPKQK